MSLQVNLSSQDIAKAYNDVLNANGIDWALFTYEKGTNDLKVQSTGSGGLEELEEEFSDGRIQYAFVRVVDPNSQLPKFVQINWCGDGVPEVKKGLFHTHSNAVSRFLRGAHVVLQARNESDVAPSLIMQRVEAASGAKYSSHKEAPRKFEPIAPVGSSYKPVGRPDIAAMKAAPPPAPAGKPSLPTTARPAGAASLYGRPAAAGQQKSGSAPEGAWPEDKPKAAPAAAAAPAPPPPAASRPAFMGEVQLLAFEIQ